MLRSPFAVVAIAMYSPNVTTTVSDYTWSYTWSYMGLIKETMTDSHPAESRENKQVPSNAGRRAESRSDIKTTAKPRPCFKVKVMLLRSNLKVVISVFL